MNSALTLQNVVTGLAHIKGKGDIMGSITYFFELYDEEWHDGFALKFFAAVRLSRLFWPMLKAAKGNIVNIVGGAARVPDQAFLIGGSVNAALTNFSKGLASLGKRDGVNVTADHGVAPSDR